MQTITRYLAAALTIAVLGVARGQQPVANAPANGLRMPRIFGNGMVLQRGQPIALWGGSIPGREVVARLGSSTGRARADVRGAWSLELPARAAGGPFQLVVQSGSDSLLFSDVLVGDVWVASG